MFSDEDCAPLTESEESSEEDSDEERRKRLYYSLEDRCMRPI